jgi:hypothetical protein
MNRVVSEGDKNTLYNGILEVGDLLFVKPRKVYSDGRGDLNFDKICSVFPDIRDGATIWFDGDSLGELNSVMLRNNGEMNPWINAKGEQIKTITLRPIPGTQLKVVANTWTPSSQVFLCQGVLNMKVLGESGKYFGLKYWPLDRVFLRGSFGISVTVGTEVLKNRHMLSLNTLPGGELEIDCVEAGGGGFAGIRVLGHLSTGVAKLKINNVYVFDTGSEGLYLGSTKPLYYNLRDVEITNTWLVRCGTEPFQLQHIVGKGRIENVMIYAADVGYLNAFQPWQDNAIQFVADSGNYLCRNIIVDGYASRGLHIQSGGNGAEPQSEIRFRKILFNGGKGGVVYHNGSTSKGIKWTFDDIIVQNCTKQYYQDTGVKEEDYMISNNHGSDHVEYCKLTYDGSLPRVFQDTRKLTVGEILQKLPIPVEYRNSGFTEPATDIVEWHYSYGYYFPVSKGSSIPIPVKYKEGQIVIDREDKVGITFHKVLKDHTSPGIRPKHDKEHFSPALTWDATGVRSDQSDWDAQSKQFNYPPDDLRLLPGSEFQRMGFGYDKVEKIIESYIIGGDKLIVVTDNNVYVSDVSTRT